MYFFIKEGRQYLDLTGNLILSHNDRLIKTRNKSAAPTKILNATYVVDLKHLTFIAKIRLVIMIFKFVFGKSQRLTEQDTNKK